MLWPARSALEKSDRAPGNPASNAFIRLFFS